MTSSRKLTGPLTQNQHRVLAALAEGLNHTQVSERLGFARQTISENVCAAAAKMGCANSTEAVAKYQAYRIRADVAGFVADMARTFAAPNREAAEHTDRVLRHTAKLIMERAQRDLPK